MVHKNTLRFLKRLRENNLKAWVDEHRVECDAAKADFENVARWLVTEVSIFDPLVAHARLDPRRCMSRLNRDTRFHQGLPSFKTEIYCVANYRGRKGKTAGYFVRIAAEGCAVGAGVLAPRAPDLRRYRELVSDRYEELQKILKKPAFRRACPSGLYREGQLKNVPAGFDSEDPAREELRLKHFTTFEDLSDTLVTSPAGANKMLDVLVQSQALVELLNRHD